MNPAGLDRVSPIIPDETGGATFLVQMPAGPAIWPTP